MYSMQDFLLPGAANVRQPRHTNPGTQQNQTAPRTTYRPQQECYYNPAQRQQPSQHHLNNNSMYNMPHPRQVQVIQRQASTNVVPGVGNTANYPHITNSRHHTNASPNPQAAHNRSMRTERCVIQLS